MPIAHCLPTLHAHTVNTSAGGAGPQRAGHPREGCERGPLPRRPRGDAADHRSRGAGPADRRHATWCVAPHHTPRRTTPQAWRRHGVDVFGRIGPGLTPASRAPTAAAARRTCLCSGELGGPRVWKGASRERPGLPLSRCLGDTLAKECGVISTPSVTQLTLGAFSK